MRRISTLFAGGLLAVGLLAQAAGIGEPSALNLRILDYCRLNLGKKVGTGECADLAYRAMLASGAESPDLYKDDPRPGDYVWGRLIYRREIRRGAVKERGSKDEVHPGDIVQMRDVIIEHTEETDHTITTETIDADHHTAIIESVSPDGLTYDVLEQNSNDVPTVTQSKLRIGEMKRGYVLVYRAIPSE